MRNAGYVMFDVMVPYKAGSRAILRSPVYESILLAQKLLCSAIVGGGPDLDLPERRCWAFWSQQLWVNGPRQFNPSQVSTLLIRSNEEMSRVPGQSVELLIPLYIIFDSKSRGDVTSNWTLCIWKQPSPSRNLISVRRSFYRRGSLYWSLFIPK